MIYLIIAWMETMCNLLRKFSGKDKKYSTASDRAGKENLRRTGGKAGYRVESGTFSDDTETVLSKSDERNQ